MAKVKTAEFDALEPIVKNKRVQIDGALAMAFHNKGEVDVTLNDFWTVPAGGNFMMALPQTDVVIYTQIDVKFAAGAGTKRLEISTLRMTGTEFSNL